VVLAVADGSATTLQTSSFPAPFPPSGLGVDGGRLILQSTFTSIPEPRPPPPSARPAAPDPPPLSKRQRNGAPPCHPVGASRRPR
jgi:hypothetical protein